MIGFMAPDQLTSPFDWPDQLTGESVSGACCFLSLESRGYLDLDTSKTDDA